MINSYIDQTNLKTDATQEDIIALCDQALQYKFKSVCVPPCYVRLAAAKLEHSETRVCTVVGFPLGYTDTKTKVFEATQAALDGALEIDVVININKLKQGDREYLIDELSSIKKAIKGRVLKVILETGVLSEEEKHLACEILNHVSPDYAKTSTGFAGKDKGATVEDVTLLRSLLNSEIRIKASGGIRNYADAKEMIKAGAQRIGTSAGVAIYDEYLVSDLDKQVKNDYIDTEMIDDDYSSDDYQMEESVEDYSYAPVAEPVVNEPTFEQPTNHFEEDRYDENTFLQLDELNETELEEYEMSADSSYSTKEETNEQTNDSSVESFDFHSTETVVSHSHEVIDEKENHPDETFEFNSTESVLDEISNSHDRDDDINDEDDNY
ncbi:deoxyribose-phosphate aldolase [Mycoplasmoides fastidiosum]|uniref:Deoxyribose-phosphate aldolase n=1 Tax=Mycoplasmoides fastidiosum TaxID=92758 RepID=A0ABU0LYV0_9BACT|nr:deoxyribose-phosphate aldolase [Mycoplasmoides fastidiosum]MDQ0513780.1 deoxyribose-phosphate aldolase [Mycoplasmoides fastidiosum]UUD37801.1 deoxyribose-phosphate aldolase [Mycoplasmoides fastidiosum]